MVKEMVEHDRISLKDYFDTKFASSDKALDLAFEALKVRLEGIDKASEVERRGMESRLESMNGFRAQLNSQATTFLTKEAYEGKHEAIEAKVDSLRMNEATLSGKASQSSVFFSYIIAGLSIIISVIGLIVQILLKHSTGG